MSSILTSDSKDMIVGMLSAIDVPKKQKINMIESVMTAVHLHAARSNEFPESEQFAAVTLITLVFDVLLDTEINPAARDSFLKGFDLFACNIYGAVKGGECRV